MSAAVSVPNEAPLEVNTRPWWMTLIRGILAVIVGGVLLFGSFNTQVQLYLLLVTLLGLYWLIDGILDIVHMFTDHRGWGWKLFMGIISIIAGSLILIYPTAAAVALPSIFVFVLGFWGVVNGIILLIMAFRGGGWGAGIMGVIGILLGGVLLANWSSPGWGLSLIWVAALFAFFGGFVAIWRAFQQRKA